MHYVKSKHVELNKHANSNCVNMPYKSSMNSVVHYPTNWILSKEDKIKPNKGWLLPNSTCYRMNYSVVQQISQYLALLY